MCVYAFFLQTACELPHTYMYLHLVCAVSVYMYFDQSDVFSHSIQTQGDGAEAVGVIGAPLLSDQGGNEAGSGWRSGQEISPPLSE